MHNTHTHKNPSEVVLGVRARVHLFARRFDSRTRVRVAGGQWLTRAAAHVLRHDAAEVPEARLAAVALLAANARLAGALAAGWVTRPLVGAVDVALAGACGGGGERF